MIKKGPIVKLSEQDIASIKELLSDGLDVPRIAFKFGVSKNSLYGHFKRNGIVLTKRKPNKEPKPKKSKLDISDYASAPPEVMFDYRNYPSF